MKKFSVFMMFMVVLATAFRDRRLARARLLKFLPVLLSGILAQIIWTAREPAPLGEALPRHRPAAHPADPRAGPRFRSIAPFYRKNFLRWIDSAKRPETRAARIAEMVQVLADGRQER